MLNATNVWIDGNTFDDGDRHDKLDPPVPTWAAPFNVAEQEVQHHDGLVDVTLFGSHVTLSHNHFRDHDKTSLLGGTDVALRYSDGTQVVRSGPDKLAPRWQLRLCGAARRCGQGGGAGQGRRGAPLGFVARGQGMSGCMPVTRRNASSSVAIS